MLLLVVLQTYALCTNTASRGQVPKLYVGALQREACFRHQQQGEPPIVITDKYKSTRSHQQHSHALTRALKDVVQHDGGASGGGKGCTDGL